MIQLNLLPDVKKEFLKSQKTKATVISASIIITVAAVGVAVLLFVYVIVVQQIQIGLIGNDITSKSSELNNIKDLGKYLTVQNQLKALPDLHDKKGVYSRLFSLLPLVNPSAPNNIRLTGLQVQTVEKSVNFVGATASFESLNIFVDTLNNAEVTYKPAGSDESKTEKVFDKVFVQSSGLAKIDNTTTVSFTLVATYKESVFDATNSKVEFKVPNIQTTSSVTGSPATKLFDNQGGQ